MDGARGFVWAVVAPAILRKQDIYRDNSVYAVLEALSWAFFCGAEADEGDGGDVRCPKLSRLWLSSWHGIAMSQLIDDGGGASARWSEVVAAGEETGLGDTARSVRAAEYVCKI